MSTPDFSAAIYDRQTEHEIVAHWWRARGIEPLPQRAMPRFGVWAMVEEVRMAAAFGYMTTSELAIMAFAIANPALDEHQQATATAYAIQATTSMIREASPKGIIISLCHQQSAHQAYVKRAGFHGTGKTWIGVSAPDGVNLDILTE